MKTALLLVLGAVSALSAGLAGAASLAHPEDAGLRLLDKDIYVSRDLSAEQSARVLRLVDAARQRVRNYYGELRAHPKIVICPTRDCYRDFGAVGLGFTDGGNLVISPQGMRVAIIAHELAHDELSARIGGFAQVVQRVPQWFDEGQAVMVSEAGEFSDAAWSEATDNGKEAPPLGQLVSMENWNRLTGAEGEHMQFTYGTAAREVRRWFRQAGPDGLRDLLASLRGNLPFAAAYARAETGVGQPTSIAASDAPPPASSDFEAVARSATAKAFVRAAW